MFIAMAGTLFLCSPYFVWQFLIRPYCLKNGKGYTTGMNFAATMWVDWQDARELAVSRGDRKIIRACNVFLGMHLALLAAFVLLLVMMGGSP